MRARALFFRFAPYCVSSTILPSFRALAARRHDLVKAWADEAESRMQELSVEQLTALYSLLGEPALQSLRTCRLPPKLLRARCTHKLTTPPRPSAADDDGDGALTVHEMIDLFDGVNNDALLIDVPVSDSFT